MNVLQYYFLEEKHDYCSFLQFAQQEHCIHIDNVIALQKPRNIDDWRRLLRMYSGFLDSITTQPPATKEAECKRIHESPS